MTSEKLTKEQKIKELAEIDKYVIVPYPGIMTAQMHPDATYLVIPHIYFTQGTEYKFTVRSVNLEGRGTDSALSEGLTYRELDPLSFIAAIPTPTRHANQEPIPTTSLRQGYTPTPPSPANIPTPAPPPLFSLKGDLEILGFRMVPSAPSDGQTVDLYIEYRNNGPGFINDSYMTIGRSTNSIEQTVSTYDLVPGQVREAHFSWAVLQGQTYYLNVDPDNGASETNENNNSYQFESSSP